jgi:hypothetical protein
MVKRPELTVVLFERPGWDDATYRRWSQHLAKTGVMLCVPTSWQGRMVLRLAFVNPATDAAQVIEILRATTASRRYPPGG